MCKKALVSVREIFPDVLSVSRATDIPAFHVDWFMARLREGFSLWQNPFNANQRQKVSFEKVKVIVFWSKNPSRLLPYLDEITERGKKFYFQFTLNDYEAEDLEPGIPPLAERLETFMRLSKDYKVIWRYDPIIVGDRLTIKRHIQIIKNLMQRIGDQTDKLVFSFVDMYNRVAKNLERFNCDLRAPSTDEILQFSSELIELRNKFAPNLRLATCAEAEVDLNSLGIEKNSCIDPELINRICSDTIYLKEASLLRIAYAKDKGQRKACQCAPSKDIGSYRSHPCRHACRYCYAGHV